MLTQAITGWNEQPIRDVMLHAIPDLRAFAISLSGKVDRADDLVQETLLRAMANISSFQPGTNMSAWLTTILRNLFVSDYRKRRYDAINDFTPVTLLRLPSSIAGWNSTNFVERLQGCRLTSARPCSW